MLAEVALALRVLDRHPRRGHLVADPADQRLDPRRPEQRVVDVVEVGRLEVVEALLPGLLVGVAEDDELELGAGVGDQPALGQPGELAAQDLPRRGDDLGAVAPLQVGHHHRRPLLPRHRAQRVEVGDHLEVAVAALPGGHRVAADRLHVDVDREQVVAALGAVLERRRRGSGSRSGACPAAAPPCRRSRAARCRPCRPRPPSSAPRASPARRYAARSRRACAHFGRSDRLLDVDLAHLPGEVLAGARDPGDRGEQDHGADRERRVVERLPAELRRSTAPPAGVNGRQKMIVISPTQKAANVFIHLYLLPRFQAGTLERRRPCASAGRSGSRRRCRARSR